MAVGVVLCLMTAVWKIQAQCDSVELVTRQQWGAASPKHTVPLHLPVNTTVIHHTAGPHCYTLSECVGIVKGIQNYHMKTRGWDDIGYSFIIGEDGRVYEGRGWYNLPAHSPGYNYFSYGMSIMGNFMDAPPNVRALQATQSWIQCAVDQGHVISGYQLLGHRDTKQTSCPGDALYGVIQGWPHYKFRQISGAGTLRYHLALLATSCLLAINFIERQRCV